MVRNPRAPAGIWAREPLINKAVTLANTPRWRPIFWLPTLLFAYQKFIKIVIRSKYLFKFSLLVLNCLYWKITIILNSNSILFISYCNLKRVKPNCCIVLKIMINGITILLQYWAAITLFDLFVCLKENVGFNTVLSYIILWYRIRSSCLACFIFNKCFFNLFYKRVNASLLVVGH